MPSRGGGPRQGGGFDFLVLIGIVAFVASATLAAGVFLYAQYLQTSATSKLEQLERAKQAFEPSLIQDLTRLDSRMRAADAILGEHVAPTALFRLLEQLTLQTVAFSAFDFSATSEGLTLVMKGVAQSVNSIALQADLLSKSGVISNPIFSNINRQQNGVNFDFTADVNAEPLNYVALMNAAIAPMPGTGGPEESTSPFGTPGDSGQPPGPQGTPPNGPQTGPPPSL